MSHLSDTQEHVTMLTHPSVNSVLGHLQQNKTVDLEAAVLILVAARASRSTSPSHVSNLSSSELKGWTQNTSLPLGGCDNLDQSVRVKCPGVPDDGVTVGACRSRGCCFDGTSHENQCYKPGISYWLPMQCRVLWQMINLFFRPGLLR